MKLPKPFGAAFLLATMLFAGNSFAGSQLCDGVINDRTIFEDIEVLAGQSCIINDSTVLGLIVGDSPATVIIYRTNVKNKIVIDNADTVAISDVKVEQGNVVVTNSGVVSLVDNRTDRGEIRVKKNIEAYGY